MIKRRLIAMLLCIAMIGSMSVYAVGDDVTCTCGTATEEHTAACGLYNAPEQTTAPVCSCGTGSEEHAEGCTLYTAPVPACTCGTETEEHAEGCALYTVPTPACTCGTETEEHAEGCALYESPAPTDPVPTEPVPTEPEVTEPDAAPTVAQQLLATESTEEMYLLMVSLMDTDLEGLMALTRVEIAQIRARVAELDPESDDPDTQEVLDNLALLPNGAPAESAYDLIAASASMQEMWNLLTAEENAEGVAALTGDEINALVEHTLGRLYHTGQEPTEAQIALCRQIKEKLHQLAVRGNEASTFLAGSYNWSGTITASDYAVYQGQTLNITLTGNVTLSGIVYVYGTLNINTNGAYTISGSVSQLFEVNENGSLTINGTAAAPITLKGINNGSWAAIQNLGTLNLNYVKIQDAKRASTGYGGAIEYQSSVNSTLSNCTIQGCTAGEGSAICFLSGTTGSITLKDTTVQNCVAENGNYGGTIRSYSGTDCKVRIESCTIRNNIVRNCTSASNGGGVYWNANGTNASMTITGTAEKPTVISNNSSDNGGGIFGSARSITINNTHILNNSAPDGGGINIQPYSFAGISGASSSLVLGENTVIKGNSATNGGGIYMDIFSGSTTAGETFTIDLNNGATIEENTATYGGAFALTQRSDGGNKYHAYLNINGGTIRNNNATNGGAFYINRSGYTNASAYKLEVKVAGGLIENNTAANYGGGIYLADDASVANVTVSGGEIKTNTAVNGGAVYLSGGNFKMTSGTFDSNSATKSSETDSGRGGAVYVKGGTFTMTGGTITKSTSQDRGGAAFVSGTFNMNGGKMTDNTSQKFGGAAYVSGTFKMTNGEMTGNKATGRGGAVYVVNGSFTISNGTISNNESVDGGAAYIRNGTFTMENGTIKENKATNDGGAIYVIVDEAAKSCNATMKNGSILSNTARNGGAVYVKGGTFTMENGTISNNTASQNGGAAYVTTNTINGTVKACNATMKHGNFLNNTALNGGAVYVNGGSFVMESGNLNNNNAVQNTAGAAEAGTEGYGGAVYANNGNITIGISGCRQDAPCDYHAAGKTTHHPVITGNEAVFGGGFAINNGTVTLYCCNITLNESDNKGTGMNIFMSGASGVINHHYHGAEIGDDTDHGMVSIGGQLNIEHDGGTLTVNVNYYSNDMDFRENHTEVIWTGVAPNDYYLNLPYCPSDWKPVPESEGYTFAGWTESVRAQNIRSKLDYKSVGDAVEIRDTNPGEATEINFYAVWAKVNNNIAYTYSLDGETIVSFDDMDALTNFGEKPESYKFQMTSYDLSIPTPTRVGYAFKGWMMYAEDELPANWDKDATSYEPDKITQIQNVSWKKDGNNADIVGTINVLQNFGDIVMVAVFEPQFADLTITKTGSNTTLDAKATYIYQITGTPADTKLSQINMTVMIPENNTVKIVDLPVGTYTVTEMSNWSWRYDVEDITVTNASGTQNGDSVTFALMNPAVTVNVKYDNKRTEPKWLDGYWWKKV